MTNDLIHNLALCRIMVDKICQQGIQITSPQVTLDINNKPIKFWDGTLDTSSLLRNEGWQDITQESITIALEEDEYWNQDNLYTSIRKAARNMIDDISGMTAIRTATEHFRITVTNNLDIVDILHAGADPAESIDSNERAKWLIRLMTPHQREILERKLSGQQLSKAEQRVIQRMRPFIEEALNAEAAQERYYASTTIASVHTPRIPSPHPGLQLGTDVYGDNIDNDDDIRTTRELYHDRATPVRLGRGIITYKGTTINDRVYQVDTTPTDYNSIDNLSSSKVADVTHAEHVTTTRTQGKFKGAGRTHLLGDTARSIEAQRKAFGLD